MVIEEINQRVDLRWDLLVALSFFHLELLLRSPYKFSLIISGVFNCVRLLHS